MRIKWPRASIAKKRKASSTSSAHTVKRKKIENLRVVKESRDYTSEESYSESYSEEEEYSESYSESYSDED
ncbi:hypothetical protein NPIL_42711 [Nephila pilipes]|uniref:Uncharacterized protein n=1 Tax=Nephila pilipes TaxID=299642 RepID=A0A8X6TF72_NEPPI|nr:hypothetical protein NPIL_42711 [Nephila pilipes]